MSLAVNEDLVDVIVVGAGLAGLSAARALLLAGRSVRVLEARPRVGGRTCGAQLLDLPVDLGGQWVGPTQPRVLRLCEELRLQTFPQSSDGRRLLHLNQRLQRYRGTIPRVSPLALVETAVLFRRINRAAQQLDEPHPRREQLLRDIDEMTAQHWLQHNALTRSARKLALVLVRAVCSAEPHELSAGHFLRLVHSAGGIEALAEVRQGAQQLRIAGGAFQLAQRLAELLPPNAVRLNAPVLRIAQGGDTVTVHTLHDRLKARRVVLALPPALAGRIHYDLPLPPLRDGLTQRLAMGSAIKVVIAYARPFWRAAGLSGEAVSDVLPLSPVFDASLPNDVRGLLVGFLAADQAREMGELSAAERRRHIIDSLQAYFGPQAREPLGLVEQDWTRDPWSRGCYAALAAPGAWSRYGRALSQPCGQLHFAGTETAEKWLGYMEGALESGDRVAREVLNALGGA